MERSWSFGGRKPTDYINLNDRTHHMVKYRLAEVWKQSVWAHANQRPKPRIPDESMATVHVAFGVTNPSARRDPHNWMPTIKAMIDALTDMGFWKDDDFTHVTVLEPTFERATTANYTVTITWEEPDA